MHRIETTRDPIDEAAPRARGAIHDLQILPAERDRPRPLDGLAPQLPATVVEPLDRPPDRPARRGGPVGTDRSEEHTSELQSRLHLVCRLLLEKKKKRSKRRARSNTE